MKRITDVDMEVRVVKFETALNKFFKKYPELINNWKEVFEWMHESNTDFYCDNKMGDGTENKEWGYALYLDEEENYYYFAVIEKA